jgi:uncharacterized membrane protein YidH (DUF202 family)
VSTGPASGGRGRWRGSGGIAARRVVDEGLQGERTSLAWERTALALAANAALLARAGGEGVPAARVVAFVVLALAALGFIAARTRYVRRDDALRGVGQAPGHRTLLLLGVTAVGVSVTVLAVVVGLAVA